MEGCGLAYVKCLELCLVHGVFVIRRLLSHRENQPQTSSNLTFPEDHLITEALYVKSKNKLPA